MHRCLDVIVIWVGSFFLQVTSSLGEGLYLSNACCDGAAQDDCLINSSALKASRGIMGLSLLSQGFQ